jgi:hypothetical protein
MGAPMIRQRWRGRSAIRSEYSICQCHPCALKAGDEAATAFPRVYLDADVEIGANDIWELANALEAPGVLGAAPERQLDLTRSARLVRWYYDIWQRLAGVQRGLFGRGVVARQRSRPSAHRRTTATTG